MTDIYHFPMAMTSHSQSNGIQIAHDANGNLYAVNYCYYDNNKYQVWKSSDGGESWSHIDSTHDKATHSYFVHQAGPWIAVGDDVIYVFHEYGPWTSGSSYYYTTLYIYKFNMSSSGSNPDTWESTEWTLYMVSAYQTGAPTYSASVRSDGDLILLHDQAVNNGGTYYDRVNYSRVEGTTITKDIDVDGANDNDTQHWTGNLNVCFSMDNDEVWFHYYNGSYTTYGKTLSAANSLSSATTPVGAGGIPYMDGSTKKLRHMYMTYDGASPYHYHVRWALHTYTASGTYTDVDVGYTGPWSSFSPDLLGFYWNTTLNSWIGVWRDNGYEWYDDYWNDIWIDLSDNSYEHHDATQWRDWPNITWQHHCHTFNTDDKIYWVQNITLSGYQQLNALCVYDFGVALYPDPVSAGAETSIGTVEWGNFLGKPILDYSNVGWFKGDHVYTNLYTEVDEDDPDNNDFIITPPELNGQIVKFKITPLSDPGEQLVNLKATYFLSAINPMLSSYPDRDLYIRLYQSDSDGSNRIDIKELNYTSISSETPANVEVALSSGEKALITDWAKLYIEVEAYTT